MKVLAFAEQRDGKLKPAALEALSAGAQLAGEAANLAAVVIGKGVENLAHELKGHGADKVYVIEAEACEKYHCPNYTKALEAAVSAFSADVVVGGATPMGKDLFPRLAARASGGLLTDVIELTVNGNGLEALKPMYAGKVLAKVSANADGLKLATVRPNTFSPNKTGQGEASLEKLEVSFDDSRLSVKEIRKGASEKADLTEAALIISGGRAMANADNFKILHECADVIGATVGASRAAVDSGYAPHDMQVGQTGKTVNPNLYIACGISGSIQHMAGMRTSKVIVAVNTDPDAPIFGIADYGIVADLFEAVPLMTKKLKEIL